MTGRKASQACLGRSLLYLCAAPGTQKNGLVIALPCCHASGTMADGVFTAAEPWLVPQPGRQRQSGAVRGPAHVTAPGRLFVLPLLQTAWRPPASSQYCLYFVSTRLYRRECRGDAGGGGAIQSRDRGAAGRIGTEPPLYRQSHEAQWNAVTSVNSPMVPVSPRNSLPKPLC